MLTFTISIDQYSANFRRPMSIPVFEDTALPVGSGLRQALRPLVPKNKLPGDYEPLNLTLDEAIQSSDRYLAIEALGRKRC
ncbi:MAG: hypothetical protein HY744_31790 [Deltaproteobacteria bacterium]|nr:hypothetical protein [Deltaproteobacteria bacterium]